MGGTDEADAERAAGGHRMPGDPDPEGVQSRHPGWSVTGLGDGGGYQGTRTADGTVLTGLTPESLDLKITAADRAGEQSCPPARSGRAY